MSSAPDTKPRRQRPPVTRQERRWVLLFALLVMTATYIPYLLGAWRQGDEYVFSGFIFAVEDGHSYIAKMLSGAMGDWLFRSPYTAYPQKGFFVFLPYLLLGKLAAPPGLHEQLIALYHLFRFVAGALMILATYDFSSYFVSTVRWRRWALAFITLGGGLGWLLVLAGQSNWAGSLPLEYISPETFGFLSLYGLPHLALGRAAMLWALLIYLDAARQPAGASPRQIIRLSLLWVLGGLLQPMLLVLIGGWIGWHLFLMASWLVIRRRHGLAVDWTPWMRALRLAAAAGLAPGVLLAYNLLVVRLDPYAATWMAQNRLFSPSFLHYTLAYGIVISYAIVGARQWIKEDAWRGWFLAGWALLLPALAYAPVTVQRRLVEGMWVLLVLLAVGALEACSFRRSQPAQRWLLAPWMLLFPSTLILWAGGVLTVLNASPPLFLPRDEVRVFEYLQTNAAQDDVVLASYQTSNALPAWAPLRVVIGHGPESSNQAQLLPRVQAFYTAAAPTEERDTLIGEFAIKYIFWGPAERALGDWNPGQEPWLKPIFQPGAYSLYEVTRLP